MVSRIAKLVIGSIFILGLDMTTSYAAHPDSQTANSQFPLNVVLVHGAWANSSSWAKVIPLLEAKGIHVVAVQMPLTSLADDVAATRRAIALQDGPVLLVGHSYGGAVITEAGNDPKVSGLVYVAAFAPNDGEAVGAMGKDFPVPPGAAELRPDQGGFLKLTPKGIAEDFAQDLTAAEKDLLTATQGPTNGAAFGGTISHAAWKTKPSWYAISSNDRMIAPDFERAMASQMKATSISLASSHVAMLSHPVEVARLITDAANAPR
jgi:pimeloyl-ACP methyl ester carboxylesterase